MKFIYILICLAFGITSIYSQDALYLRTRAVTDSIVNLIALEKDEQERINLLLSLYLTRIEAHPDMFHEIGQKIYAISEKENDPVTASSAWSLFGQVYRLSGNYTKALECHHKAIALAETVEDKSLLAIAQNQMAHIYKDRQENEKALRLYLAAKQNALKGKNEVVSGWPDMNLGAIYLAMNQLDSSLYYSNRSYEKLAASTPFYLSMVLANMAGAYSKMGNDEQALLYYRNAITESLKSQHPRFINIAYIGLAEHYLRKDQQDSSIYYARKAIHAVQNTVLTFLSIKPAKLLTDIYEKSNADSTLKYLRIYRAANDSLFNSRAEQQLQMMTFEEDQRQQELALEKSKFQNKIRTNILLGVTVTICLIALILYRNNKQKQKANLLLQIQKAEIESTLSKLKAAQAQLVHAEKMASLGELTAGIAHEIQNPLNFVNNFSEVSHELLDEMRGELARGNQQQAIEIAENVKENLEKITHHGKRADAIVKGMLQHSRVGSGIKEPTDINALCDEYLRLAYHGFRAKDKSFNATTKTDFDDSIGLINVIPQDIGRVILNLITNAFYAVSAGSAPKPPKGGLNSPNGEWIPTVIVSTKRWKSPLGDLGAEISVKDNGPGIPQHILDKIFQPFFTTKPTGQGTGLGLSLSYDIVKAHGGEIQVNTKEGEGTEFIIHLPVS